MFFHPQTTCWKQYWSFKLLARSRKSIQSLWDRSWRTTWPFSRTRLGKTNCSCLNMQCQTMPTNNYTESIYYHLATELLEFSNQQLHNIWFSLIPSNIQDYYFRAWKTGLWTKKFQFNFGDNWPKLLSKIVSYYLIWSYFIKLEKIMTIFTI